MTLKPLKKNLLHESEKCQFLANICFLMLKTRKSPANETNKDITLRSGFYW